MDVEQRQLDPLKIMVVDDIEVNVSILRNILQEQGYEVLGAQSVQEALDIMNNTMPQLILSDYAMPGMNGLDFCKMLKGNPLTRDIPFMFITVADSSEDKKTAFEAGVVDFIRKPFEPIEVIMRVNNQLSSVYIQQEMENYNRMMHKMVTDHKMRLEKERENVLLTLARVIAKRDPKMEMHLKNVGYNCYLLAQSVQLVPKYEKRVTDEFIGTIQTAAKVHDIGSILISDEILSREYPSRQERREALIKAHTEEGAKILEDICKANGSGRYLDMAIPIARYHHAHWDGKGYPAIGGEDIPLAARITSIANDFDNLVGHGDDERRHTVEESVKIINERSGTYYDARVVEVFNKIRKQLRTS